MAALGLLPEHQIGVSWAEGTATATIGNTGALGLPTGRTANTASIGIATTGDTLSSGLGSHAAFIEDAEGLGGGVPSGIDAAEEARRRAAQAALNREVALLKDRIRAWKIKLTLLAKRYSDSPELLQQNPYWVKLLYVKNSLEAMLDKVTQIRALDHTRM